MDERRKDKRLDLEGELIMKSMYGGGDGEAEAVPL